MTDGVAHVVLRMALFGLAIVLLAPLVFWIADRGAERAARRRARAWALEAARQRERDFGKFNRP